jgi:Spy/CpxP family protein refolding chaperone
MSENSVKQKAALWVGVVFLLGAALGGVLGYVFAHSAYAGAIPQPITDTAKRAQKVARLTKELDLSSEQQQQLDIILGEVMGRYKAIHDSTGPQIDVERQKGRERIRAILTPDQGPKFEDFLRRIDDERKKSGSGK